MNTSYVDAVDYIKHRRMLYEEHKDIHVFAQNLRQVVPFYINWDKLR